MEFNARLDMKPTEEMRRSHGLGIGGPIQKFVDSECIRGMSLYTPMLSGALEKSAIQGTVIGSGKIVYLSPYARYQYYGMLMVDSVTGSSWSPLGGKKVLTETSLQYNLSRHPLAGAKWFERWKADHLQELIAGCQKMIGGK